VELSEFTCPVCRKAFHAPTTLIGESAACPRCGANVDSWPPPTSRVPLPASPLKPATSSPRPAKPDPLPSSPIPLPPTPVPLTPASMDSSRATFHIVLGIGIALGLIVLMVASFMVARTITAKWGVETDVSSPVTTDDDSGSHLSDRHLSDRVRLDRLIISAFPIRSDVDGGYWFTYWISTTDPTRNANFVAWSKNASRLPPMTDDLNNQYKAFIPLADPNDPATQLLATDQIERVRKIPSLDLHLRRFMETLPSSLSNGSGSVTSLSARGDLIGYQPIVPAATKLYLTLPAENAGGSGVLQFEFNVERLEKLYARSR
jgi:hypothetical protein